MAKITQYVCDICKHTQSKDGPTDIRDTGNRQMYSILLAATLGSRDVPGYQHTINLSPEAYRATALWCRDCCTRLGLFHRTRQGEQVPDPITPTLEDMVRSIAYDTANDVIREQT